MPCACDWERAVLYFDSAMCSELYLPDLFCIDDKWTCVASFLLHADNDNTISFTGF